MYLLLLLPVISNSVVFSVLWFIQRRVLRVRSNLIFQRGGWRALIVCGGIQRSRGPREVPRSESPDLPKGC
jgi:hypothetical protein